MRRRPHARVSMLLSAAFALGLVPTLLVAPGLASATAATAPGPGGMSIEASVYVGGEAKQPVLDAKHSRLYVPDGAAPAVTAIDLISNQVISRVLVDKKADSVSQVLLDPVSGRLFADTTGVDEIVAIDTKTNKVMARIPVAPGAHDLAIDPGRGQLFVFSPEANRIQVISTRTLRMIRSARPPKHALSMALDNVHGWLYFDGYNSATSLISVINTRTWKTVFTIPGPDIGGGSMTLDVAANRLYASLIDDEDPGTMEIIDTKARKAIGDVSVGMWPGPPVLDVSHHRIYLASGNEPDLAVIDTLTNTVVGQISSGGDTHTPVVETDRQRLFAVMLTDEAFYLAMMNAVDNTTMGLIEVDDAYGKPVLDPATRHAYLSGDTSGTITVVALPA